MSAAYATAADDSSDDADFNFESNVGSRRYPVHDSCEFEDADSLRRLIFVRQDDSDSSSSSSCSSSEEHDDTTSSSGDEDDDNAAAHAAAVGHAPLHHPPKNVNPTETATINEPQIISKEVIPESSASGTSQTYHDKKGEEQKHVAIASTDQQQQVGNTDGIATKNVTASGSTPGENEANEIQASSLEAPSETPSETPSGEVQTTGQDEKIEPKTTADSKESSDGNKVLPPLDNRDNEPKGDTSVPISEPNLTTVNLEITKQLPETKSQVAGANDVAPEKALKNNERTTDQSTSTGNGTGEGKDDCLANITSTQLTNNDSAMDIEMTENDRSQPNATATVQHGIVPNISHTATDAAAIIDAVAPPSTTALSTTASSLNKNSHEQKEPTAKTSTNKTSKKKSKHKEKKPSYYCPYDLNERDEDENTPLHVAIHARKLECVRLLLEAGASVHKKCDGSGPVHLAISIGAIPTHAEFAFECLSLLASYGADLSAKDESLHTPLYLACLSNLPRCVSVILSNPVGMTTLNMRADRIGGRALHACAKFDMPPRGSRIAAHHHRSAHGVRHHHHHHQAHHRNHIGGMGGGAINGGGDASLTKMLLALNGVEIDPVNNYGRTPLHVACSCGNWTVSRLLLQAGANANALDRRGLTPGKVAAKRGMVVPNDLFPILGGGAAMPALGESSTFDSSGSRDLIMDPDSSTVLLCHELCSRHRSCPPITRGGVAADPPPENVRRLHVLTNEDVGILRSAEFQGCVWETEARRAAMSDILKVHEYSYIEKISQLCLSIPDHPSAIASLDPDTAVSRWSFEAAMRAAGSICEAIDKVMAGDHRNAFCAVRPPGHHAGPRGIVTCPNDPDGSHGFCLLNNVAIGAAYARSMYRNDGIRKVAIIDFDVHHGNGTEEIVRNLVPSIETSAVRTPFAIGTLQTSKYRPWLDEHDIQDVFFASTHGYGPRDVRFVDHLQPNQGGWFYPASGKTLTTEAVRDPSSSDRLNVSDFLLTQTWTRMGEEARANCCKIIDVGLHLPRHHDVPGMQRIDLRDAYRKNILPHLMEFNPDMIFISAGFDAHKRDSMNFGYVGMIEDDYEWVTEQLVKVANSCCSGRIVSVLEGGYKIHGGIVSPFARSVASHVRALVEGGCSRELYDESDGVWESQFERQMVEEKERRRQIKLDRLRAADMERRRLRHAGAAAVTATMDRGDSKTEEVDHHPIDSSMPSTADAVGNDHHSDMEAMLKEPLNDIASHPRQHMDEPLSHNASASPLLSSMMNEHSMLTPRYNEEYDHDTVEETPRKRKRNHVDYKELFEQMKKESFTG